jgi:hypothetical protein
MIYGIQGQFGSGKSSFAAYIAKNKMDENTLILSNMKMDEWRMTNYFYFPDDELLQTVRLANLINDIERTHYTHKREKSSLPRHERGKYTKIIIAFDEAGAIANNRNYKSFDTTIAEYINQNRKINYDMYLITADGTQTEKTLRRFVDWWYYSKPLLPIPFFRDFKIVRKQKLDEEGNIMTEKYTGKDERGDFVQKQRPLDYLETIYWQPSVWTWYDDLHKNIREGGYLNIGENGLRIFDSYLRKKKYPKDEAMQIREQIENVLHEVKFSKHLKSKI